MKTLLTIIFAISAIQFFGNFAAQEFSDSTASREQIETEQEAELPQIRLQEYTIVGLARVTLPGKMRRQIFKDVDIDWVNNQQIYQKTLPSITFQFSRVKPSIFKLYEFPWLDGHMHYGSYNLAGINVKTQYKANNTLPYLEADFNRSDGHLTNAQWTSIGLRAGVHQRFTEGHIFHVGTEYGFYTRGIWKDYDIYQQDWETQTVLWKFFGSLEEEWHDQFRTKIDAVYYLDDHENAFKYNDRGFDIHGKGAVQINHTTIAGNVGFQRSDILVDDGNLTRLPSDSTTLNDYQSTIFSGSLTLQQKLKLVNLQVGALYQKSEEQKTTIFTDKIENEFIYPVGSIALGFKGKGSLFARFRPALEIYRYRYQIRSLPFNDLSNTAVVEHKNRVEAGLSLNPLSGFLIDVLASSSEVKNFPSPVATSDSLNAIFNDGGYPGWILGTLNEVQIQKISARLDWNIVPRFRLTGWLNYQKTDIRDPGNFDLAIKSKEVPYIPQIEGYGKVLWRFYQEHEASSWVNYSGNRFDDLQNKMELEDYFLLNARIYLQISDNLGFFVMGENLLDAEYEIWRGFRAPGITGTVGLRLQM
jgi:outer membrane receptor protein involved in Fe transport